MDLYSAHLLTNREPRSFYNITSTITHAPLPTHTHTHTHTNAHTHTLTHTHTHKTAVRSRIVIMMMGLITIKIIMSTFIRAIPPTWAHSYSNVKVCILFRRRGKTALLKSQVKTIYSAHETHRFVFRQGFERVTLIIGRKEKWKAQLLAVGEALEAIFWPSPGVEEETCDKKKVNYSSVSVYNLTPSRL